MQNVSWEEQSRILYDMPILPVNLWMVANSMNRSTPLSTFLGAFWRESWIAYLIVSERKLVMEMSQCCEGLAPSCSGAQKDAWLEDLSTGGKMLLCQKNIETMKVSFPLIIVPCVFVPLGIVCYCKAFKIAVFSLNISVLHYWCDQTILNHGSLYLTW